MAGYTTITMEQGRMLRSEKRSFCRRDLVKKEERLELTDEKQ